MNFNEYQVEGAKTAKQHTSLDIHAAGLSDFALGLTGEAGEVADLVKHQVFHKEHIELVEYAKELGDVLWYVAQLSNLLGIPLQVIAELNAAKLNARYKDGYSAEASANRHNTEFSLPDVFATLMEKYAK